jgi:DNA-binding MarR family transcriptional regulator
MKNQENEYAWLAFVTTAVNQYIDDHVKYADLDPLDRQAWLALAENEKARLRIMQSWAQTTYLTHMSSGAKAMHTPLRTCGYAVAAHYLAWALGDGDLMRCSDVEYIATQMQASSNAAKKVVQSLIAQRRVTQVVDRDDSRVRRLALTREAIRNAACVNITWNVNLLCAAEQIGSVSYLGLWEDASKEAREFMRGCLERHKQIFGWADKPQPALHVVRN